MVDIGSFIVEKNLWGADIDQEALDTAGEILVKLAGKKCSPNLICCDTLVSTNLAEISKLYNATLEEYEFWYGSYDYIIGNPPYIGHKQVTKEYKKILQQIYKGIYRDKSDISYCFLKKSIDLLREGGSLSFITSRYFMEGPSANGLRKYISDQCAIRSIADFYGQSIFQDAGVAACIITLVKGDPGDMTSVLKYKQGILTSEAGLFDPSKYEQFTVDKSVLKEGGWVLLSPENYEIFSRVEEKSSLTLGDVAESYQGIISGCDKAFIVSGRVIEEYGIEDALLKPWIKNSSIQKYYIKAAEQFLIYSDFIGTEEDFPNAIKHIEGYKGKLMERRECRNGIRKWYQLQWGRTNKVFDTPKIIYPYKSPDSRFAVDREGYYYSADIYSLKLKKEYEGSLSLDYIAAILNSGLFEFYFKCYAKKISEKQYDYYPNTVLKMRIPIPETNSPILKMACEIANCKNEDRKKAITYEIDREVYMLYGLNEKQIGIVVKG
jgi:adenine-specific DNA-methyltransferase